MQKDKAFLGTGWAFPVSFDHSTMRVRMVSQEEDINQSLKILFGTSPGERVMQPLFGSRLQAMVFEPLDESTLAEIRVAIERAMLFHEPRITLEAVEFEIVDDRLGHLHVHIEYTIRTTNSRANLVYPFYLIEADGPAPTSV